MGERGVVEFHQTIRKWIVLVGNLLEWAGTAFVETTAYSNFKLAAQVWTKKTHYSDAFLMVALLVVIKLLAGSTGDPEASLNTMIYRLHN